MYSNIIYAIGGNQMSITGGQDLSGGRHRCSAHLLGQAITLDADSWKAINVLGADGDLTISDSSQTLIGAQTFDGISYADGTQINAEYKLTLQDPDGKTYLVVGFNTCEPSTLPCPTVDGFAYAGDGAFPASGVPLTVIANADSPFHGAAARETAPCFTADCKIMTPDGPVAIKNLSVGDMVETRENGAQPVRWIGKNHLSGSELKLHPEMRPVNVTKDAFGKGYPECNLRLSSQSRVLITGWRAEVYFGQSETLIPVSELLNDGSVRVDFSAEDVVYYQLAIDQHDVILSEGLYCECSDQDVSVQEGSAKSNDVLPLSPDYCDVVQVDLAA